jgi:hypothetical protein
MIIKFGATPLGASYTAKWLPLDAINPLPGLIAGICILVITACSIEPVRRRCYEVLLAAHSLWPLSVAMSILHTMGSQGSALPVLLPGTLLVGLDFLVMGLDWLLRPTRVVSGGIVSDRPTEKVWHRTAYFVLEKKGRWRFLDVVWPFRYAVGQYVYLSIPCISPFLHPFSISSVPNPECPGRFTVHIKSMGPNTWSDSVYVYVLGHMTPLGHSIPKQYSFRAPTARAASVAVHRAGGGLHSSFGADAGETDIDGHMSMSPFSRADRIRMAAAQATSSASEQTAAEPARLLSSAPGSDGPLVYATPEGGAELLWKATDSWQPASACPTILVTGPFGRASVQLERYRHFVLLAGGIGVTPIAPLHYCLARGYPVVTYVSPLKAWIRRTLSRLLGLSGAAKQSGSNSASAGRLSPRNEAYSEIISSVTAKAESLLTIWTTRDRALLEAFAPLLGAEQRYDPAVDATVHATAGGTKLPAVPEGDTPEDDSPKCTSAAGIGSPKSAPLNPLKVGQKLALTKKWGSSFAILSNMVVESAASKCNVDMKVYLTNGRRSVATRTGTDSRASSTLTPDGRSVIPASALPAANGRMAAVVNPLSDAASRRTSQLESVPLSETSVAAYPAPPVPPSVPLTSIEGRPSSWTRAMSAMANWQLSSDGTISAVKGAPRRSVASEMISEEFVSMLEEANKEEAPLPVVNKDRPNIPHVLEEAAESLIRTYGKGSNGKNKHGSAPTVSRARNSFVAEVCTFFVTLWVAIWPWAKVDRSADEHMSGYDADGKVAVAVVVCGPHEFVLSALDSCRQLNAGPLGKSIAFHVHHETFLL